MGSGAFAIPSLVALLERGHDVVTVVTQPDRERGRGRQLAAPPVKVEAARLGLSVRQPQRVREPDVEASLRALAPDVQVVAAYGQILPPSVIDIARLGTVNVHGSLLPRYRGAAPIQWAIANGDAVTGVTTMMIDAGLDTGPILLARGTQIEPEETSPRLQERLAILGAEVLLETLDGLAAGTLEARPQDHSQATSAPLLRKEDSLVDWWWPASTIANRVRGFDPWPGVITAVTGKAVRLHRVRAESAGSSIDTPGRLTAIDSGGVVVACGGGTALRLLEVQPESRRVMPAAAFAAGARLHVGDELGR